MADSEQIDAQSAFMMIDHVSDLIAEAARLRENAFERAAAGDRNIAADLFEDSGSIASVALSFRYELADAHADTNDADGLIAALDQWATIIDPEDQHSEVAPVTVFPFGGEISSHEEHLR